MKRFYAFLIALFMVALSCGCSLKPDFDFTEEFYQHHQIDVTEAYNLPSGAKVRFTVNKEKSSFQPTVVIEVLPAFQEKYTNGYTDMKQRDQFTYKWQKMSVSQKKDELKKVGDMLISYAKIDNWKNDYYLYVVFWGSQDYVYDYEKDNLYIPHFEDKEQLMYETFGTFDTELVSTKNGGKEFLVNNGYATMKHGELEWTYDYQSYCIICHEGKIFEINKEKKSKPN